VKNAAARHNRCVIDDVVRINCVMMQLAC